MYISLPFLGIRLLPSLQMGALYIQCWLEARLLQAACSDYSHSFPCNSGALSVLCVWGMDSHFFLGCSTCVTKSVGCEFYYRIGAVSFLLPGLCLSHLREPLPVLWTRPGAQPPDKPENQAGGERNGALFFWFVTPTVPHPCGPRVNPRAVVIQLWASAELRAMGTRSCPQEDLHAAGDAVGTERVEEQRRHSLERRVREGRMEDPSINLALKGAGPEPGGCIRPWAPGCPSPPRSSERAKGHPRKELAQGHGSWPSHCPGPQRVFGGHYSSPCHQVGMAGLAPISPSHSASKLWGVRNWGGG